MHPKSALEQLISDLVEGEVTENNAYLRLDNIIDPLLEATDMTRQLMSLQTRVERLEKHHGVS